MKYTIPKDMLVNMRGFENDQVSVISPKDYNSILNSTELTEMTEDRVEVGIKFIVRSTYSNKLLIWEDKREVVDLDLVEPKIEGIQGYFHVIHTLDNYLRALGNISPRLMSRTHLMTLGVYYDSTLNKIYHLMNLVVLDADIQEFSDMFMDHIDNWGKIVDIISSPYICKFDKMILSTLRIVN